MSRVPTTLRSDSLITWKGSPNEVTPKYRTPPPGVPGTLRLCGLPLLKIEIQVPRRRAEAGEVRAEVLGRLLEVDVDRHRADVEDRDHAQERVSAGRGVVAEHRGVSGVGADAGAARRS